MYDAIVVGARCAGAATAMLLSRKGYRVLLVDRARFPSDMVMSTHLVWQSGVSQLKKWGLLDRLRASDCPPLRDVFLDLGEFELSGTPKPFDGVDSAFAPRRFVLDPILVEAAVDSGVELREEFSFDGLLHDDDGRVNGIRGHASGGTEVRESAKLVIGADGRNSHIARDVGAPVEHEHGKLQGTYFSYFQNVTLRGIEFVSRPRRMVYAWSTNGGQSLVGISWCAEDYRKLSGDTETVFNAELESLAPDLAGRVGAGKRDADWLGGSIVGFSKRSFGPGWALIGDAGLTMDPITAQGISNAYRDAELLADAVDDGFSGRVAIDEALANYGSRRDAASLPLLDYTAQMAELADPPPEMVQLFGMLHGKTDATSDYFGILAQSVSVPEFFDPENLARIAASD